MIENTTTPDSPNRISEETTVNEQSNVDLQSGTCETVPMRHKQIPERYGHNVATASTVDRDPSTLAEARSAPDNLKWKEAMRTEMESIW